MIFRLEKDSALASKWFCDNYVKLNEDKYHLLSLGTDHKDTISVKIGCSTVHEVTWKNYRDVTIDNKLTFGEDISKIWKKVSNKLYALSRISHVLDQNNSQFQYCPLTRMVHSKNLDNNSNKLHEHSLRITYRGHNSSFESD